MTGPRTPLTGAEVEAAGLADWRLLLGALHARFVTDWATGLRLVAEVGAAAERPDHHPDLDLRHGRVDVRLRSHDVGAVTSRDVALARAVSAVAARLGATPNPSSVQSLELALDTPDREVVRPFWAAVLGATGPARPDEVVDGAGVLPALWFQESGGDEPRQRFHLDLRVPPEVVAGRVAAAVAAGGTLVSDASAPAYWVLADADGNRVCLTTWQGRDQGSD